MRKSVEDIITDHLIGIRDDYDKLGCNFREKGTFHVIIPKVTALFLNREKLYKAISSDVSDDYRIIVDDISILSGCVKVQYSLVPYPSNAIVDL